MSFDFKELRNKVEDKIEKDGVMSKEEIKEIMDKEITISGDEFGKVCAEAIDAFRELTGIKDKALGLILAGYAATIATLLFTEKEVKKEELN